MKYYAGLDVSVRETPVCIIDERGTIIRERKVTSHPDDLVAILNDPELHIERVGLEAGPLSQLSCNASRVRASATEEASFSSNPAWPR